jgi:hypothetical protein
MPKDLPITDMTIQITEGAPITIPSADLLMDADFIKDGADLVLKGADGTTVTVDGYFNTLDAPDLVSGGMRMSPDMVESFAKSVHAGEYANALDSMNDVSAVGQITNLVGQVVITRADGTEVIAETGTVIHQGDTIETSGDGAANIMFADNTNFAISEDARLSVDEFIYDSGAQDGSSFFSMLKGAFVYTSGMIGKDDPGNVNIETPAGSIGIRGTVVMGKIDPLGENSEITIIDGAVVITNAAGTVELNDSLETVRLTNYDTAPESMGQMSANDAHDSYQSLSGVADSTFEQAFGPTSTNNTTNQTTQQQGENAGEAELTPDAEQEGSETSEPTDEEAALESSETTDQEATTESSETTDLEATGETSDQETSLETEIETIQTPTNINDTTTQTSSDSDTSTNTTTTTTTTTSSIDSTGSTTTTTTGKTTDDTESNDTVDSNLQLNNPGSQFVVREFEDAGFRVGRVATDSADSTASYSIVNGTQFYNGDVGSTPTSGLEAFTINSTTGEIFVKNTFAFNAGYQTEFTLDIQAVNGVGDSVVKSFTVQLDPLLSTTDPNDRIVGTYGDDASLYLAGTNDEILYGAKGNDVLTDSGAGNDVLMGGSGNDLLYINNTTGSESLWGGFGNDTLKVTSIDPSDTLNGGQGFDTLKLTNTGANIFDLRSWNSSNMNNIESISLDNLNPADMQQIKIDDTTINKLAGPDAALIIRATSGTNTHVYLEGDWDRLTDYDDTLFNGTTSAAYQNVNSGELVVTDASAGAVNVIETATGSVVNPDSGGTGPGDIGALDSLLTETLPPLM